MRRSLPGAVACLCLALVVAGCGGGGEESEADIKRDISETLQRGDDGLDEGTADCFADLVIDEAGLEELRDLDLSADAPPVELQDEIAAAAQRAVDECDLTEPSG